MRRAAWMTALAALLAACGSSRGDDDGGVDPGADGGSDGGSLVDGGAEDGDGGPTDGGDPRDGGGSDVTVSCVGDHGPTIVVTRPASGSGPSETLLRLTLSFEGGASGIEIDEVVQRDGGGTEVRRWDPASLSPPADFDGSAPAREGVPRPKVRWTATAEAKSSELDVCEADWWSRRSGEIEVTGRTHEGGTFETSCRLGWDPGGADHTLRFACARGVAGHLTDTFDALSDISSPVDAVIMGASAGAYASGTRVDDLQATEADVRAHVPEGFGSCPSVSDWEVRSGTHTLWRGSSSEDTWDGPIAAGTEEPFNWHWEDSGSAPSDLCVSSDGSSDGGTDCPPPSLQIVLRGTSSAGSWEWESNSFHCFDDL